MLSLNFLTFIEEKMEKAVQQVIYLTCTVL